MYTMLSKEVIVFPRIAGVQWSDTVGSTLWEGGARRSHRGYLPWSCGDCGGHPASLRRRRSYCRCMVLGAVAFGGPYGTWCMILGPW